MDRKSNTLKKFSQQVIAGYQHFFDLEQPTTPLPQMKYDQLKLFLQQSLNRHYRVRIYFNHHALEDVTLQGQLTHRLDDQRYLLQNEATNVVGIVDMRQIRYIQKID
ncbi:hypothetical protein IV38_GL000542 [Lactobacillus selangorensis]|uniref:YolD-like protein n=1 Tax=Lactobacillus selangorensis TaxID=81857 RepID=A0A0R2FVW8_9LACO|nr:hypothetical protein [Lactobacillus selangorensis]KRN29655.1 hypothetical protein IV38_GL000542 [Lactobacillus selangorensis]KRN33816.1 hypothetical protein IV40_GL000126 [Lactobacillus selangorensis]